MFKQLRKLLFVDSREVFDLRTLEDPIALKTLWDPLVSGGWNICTHRLSSNNGKRQMHVSPMAHLVCLFCIGFGVIISRFVVNSLSDPSVVTSGNMPTWLVPIFPLSFSIFGGGLLWWLYRKSVLFDKKQGTYSCQGESFPLLEVHSIQLIREYCLGDSSNYHSYEMNLVLKNGERFNVTDHSSLGAIRIDAKRLAEYLGLPVWDLIDYEIRAAMY